MTETVGEQILNAIVGHEVIVRNPRMPEVSWRGKAVAASFDPSVLIEAEDGRRYMLPLPWAVPVTNSPTGSEEE